MGVLCCPDRQVAYGDRMVQSDTLITEVLLLVFTAHVISNVKLTLRSYVGEVEVSLKAILVYTVGFLIIRLSYSS